MSLNAGVPYTWAAPPGGPPVSLFHPCEGQRMVDVRSRVRVFAALIAVPIGGKSYALDEPPNIGGVSRRHDDFKRLVV